MSEINHIICSAEAEQQFQIGVMLALLFFFFI